MTRQIQNAYIVSATRTPVGKAPRGLLKNTRPDDLLAHVIQHALQQHPKVDPADIDDVIVGCAMPEAEQGMNIARIGLLLAGLPDNVAGMTVNRFCSSGLQAVALAADRIRLGEADVMLAGGTESMSMIPMMGHKIAMNPKVFAGDNIGIAYGMGITAEKVADKWSISREAQDEFAYNSHLKASKAIENGDFTAEISPYTIHSQHAQLAGNSIASSEYVMRDDEGPRSDTNIEKLNSLRNVFRHDGSVTAGNSSQMSDGAGMTLLMSEKALKKYQIDPLARFAGFAVAGVPADIMGIGPIAAIPKVLKQHGLTQQDIDWIELNEAFAAQSLAVINELNLDQTKINPLGGAIALGHPLGATGAIRTATVVHGLQRTQQKWGMVTMCIGTGMGAAGLFERC